LRTSDIDEAAQAIRERQFAEEFGLLLTSFGTAPMFGRITGFLLICQPPEQTAAQIATALDASRGSLSTTTRQLVSAGMIEKVALPGSRATHFRVRHTAWADMMRVEMARMMVMREMAEHGLEVLATAQPERRERLEQLREFFLFMEREWPRLVDHWHARTDAKEST